MSMFLRRLLIGLICLALYSGAGWLPLTTAPSASCSQATTFLARTSGLSGTQQTAYTTMICGMVTDGTWSLLDTLYVFATNTTTTAGLNLISTSFTLTSHGSCTFTANAGYTGDASTCFQDTGFVPSSAGGNLALNSASAGACSLSSRTTGQSWALMGVSSGEWIYLSNNQGGATYYDLSDAAFPSVSASNGHGSWIASRTGSAAMALYLNGSSVGTTTTASVSLPTESVYILAYQGLSVGVGDQFTGDQVAYSFLGGALNSTQAGQVYSRLHTFLGAVGAPSGC